ncbi:Mu transposase C-terminal domain-containing protein [Streptomyces sp. NPDC039022]|uniref:Mu transposase C-terminal domain-containing protein n=1 Tax=Streptomyces sp. NPDC039022 TaxID=3157091 RepID=UPI003405DC89
MSRARPGGRPVVAVGAQVCFRGRRWQVVGLAGQHVHLSDEESSEAVLAGHLFADPGFAVLGTEVPQAVPQWGLFQTAPEAARQKALAWQRHIREVECGSPEGPGSSAVMREQYDPGRFTLAEREAAKAEELTALGFGRVTRSTVQRMRLAYRKQGLWGLVDHRTTRSPSPTGRADERVVAAVREALRRQRGRSRGTIGALIPQIGRILADRHGAGTVPLPGRSTLYRLIRAVAAPGDLPDAPARPLAADGRALVPTVALRPGEQVQIDTTRLDILARFEDGTLGRPELTTAVDVASRAVVAAVLRPAGTQAVDAALLLAEMAVPHPVRPTWPDALRLDHADVLPHARLLTVDERLDGAAARPVVVPETIVVDRGKIFLSQTFIAACETLGISVQPAPPHAPTAKGIVERTFGSINALFCQHVAGYTGSDVTRRGRTAETEACFSVPQLQDLLDEWLIHYHHRPHNGLRHPLLPKTALSPNQMWAALIAVAGYVPVPLSGHDYLELLPMRWQTITEHGIRVQHRTYDHDVLGPYRRQPSPHAARGGKWEIHHNPHDARQIWVRLPHGRLVEIPWIHRDHTHHPFNERTWQYVQSITARRTDPATHEADLADALDQLQRRARTGSTTRTEQALLARTAPARTPHPLTAPQPADNTEHTGHSTAQAPRDSIDDLDDWADDTDPTEHPDPTHGNTEETADEVPEAPALPYTGLGLYDAQAEADTW